MNIGAFFWLDLALFLHPPAAWQVQLKRELEECEQNEHEVRPQPPALPLHTTHTRAAVETTAVGCALVSWDDTPPPHHPPPWGLMAPQPEHACCARFASIPPRRLFFHSFK